jgi:hypothetical protein
MTLSEAKSLIAASADEREIHRQFMYAVWGNPARHPRYRDYSESVLSLILALRGKDGQKESEEVKS